MTIRQAIDKANSLRPNALDEADKVRFLDTLDKMLFDEIFSKHKGFENIKRPDYTESGTGTELLAPDGYTEIYINWLFSKIDYIEQDYNLYNIDLAAFNADYKNLAGYINREHKNAGGNFAVI